MPKNKKSQKMWMGFKVQVEAGPVPRPLKVQFWKKEDYRKYKPESPLHYNADALTGLALHLLHKNWQTPDQPEAPFAQNAWKELEPLWEMSQRAQARVNSLRSHLPEPSYSTGSFEKEFKSSLVNAAQPWGFDVTELHGLVDMIESLENQTGRPLLYNFQLAFTPEFKASLQHLQSFLFNLRTLVAMDYNAYIQDPSHEALKVDSISDYIPRADYIANDAVLYYQYRKIRKSLPAEPMKSLDQAFMTYSHNGAFLVENLPATFLAKLGNEELIESLYLIQMDWLMGTEAGLLYQIREEIYGLIEGYQKIFWPDYLGQKRTGEDPYLVIQCQVDEDLIFPSSSAA